MGKLGLAVATLRMGLGPVPNTFLKRSRLEE